MGEYSYQEIVI